MSETQSFLLVVLQIGRLVTAVIALFAVLAGVQDWLGVHWLLSGVVAFVVLAISPLLASIVGMMGAIQSWGMAWYWAALIFFWPLALQLALGLGFAGAVGVASLFDRKGGGQP